MSEFTDFLDNYMKENKITPAELARELNMERGTVYRYIKGSRIPSDEGIVKSMADALRMSVSDKNMLIEKYDKLNLGEQIVNSYKYICDMFHNLKNINLNLSSEISDYFSQKSLLPQQENIFLKSQKEIELCASTIFFWFAKKQIKNNTMFLLMQPIYPVILESLISVLGETGKKVEHIVCLEQRFSKSHENLKIFYSILPMCFANMIYEVQYYYEYMDHHINQLSWMPNVIIAGEYILQFDYKMECGILIHDGCYFETVKRHYLELRKQTMPFLIHGNNISETFGILKRTGANNQNDSMNTEKNIVVSMYQEPCVAICISSDIYEKYMYPSAEKEAFISFMVEQHGDWNGMIYDGNREERVISYFQMEGLQSFIETGIIHEVPVEYYHPLEIYDRKLVLRRMIYLMKKEIMIYRILKQDIGLPTNICFYWESQKSLGLSINLIKSGNISQITITDGGISQTFKQCTEYLEKKRLVYSEQETIEILENAERQL